MFLTLKVELVQLSTSLEVLLSLRCSGSRNQFPAVLQQYLLLVVQDTVLSIFLSTVHPSRFEDILDLPAGMNVQVNLKVREILTGCTYGEVRTFAIDKR